MQQPPPLPPSNPYAAPSARIDDFDSGQMELGDRLMRLVAKIVDWMIIMTVVAIIAIVAAIALPAMQKSGGSEEAVAIIVGSIALAAFLAILIVNLVLLHRYGQTIGKRLFKLRIVRVDGSHCSLLRIIFARWLPVTVLSAIPLLGYIFSLVDPLMIFRTDQRCMHDLIADTIVIKA